MVLGLSVCLESHERRVKMRRMNEQRLVGGKKWSGIKREYANKGDPSCRL